MASLVRRAERVQPIAGITRTVTLFDGGRSHPSPYFGRNITRYSGAYEGRRPYLISDVRAAARMFADASEDQEMARIEIEAAEMAHERELVRRMERELSL